MGDFKTDLEKRNLLIFAFYARKQYRDNWIQRIEIELQDETLNEKAISKKMIGLEAWKNLHPVIEKYIELLDDWDKLHFPELWNIVTGDRELADVVYMGIIFLKDNINQRRDSAGLLAMFPEMKIVSPRDSKDYQEWGLLTELENSLHEAYRQDQPQISKAEDQQGAEPVEGVPKIPGGFVGFCYRKICDLPTEAREVFLLTNKGDSSCYKYREDWLKEFGKTLSRPGDMISKAKNLYRKLN